MMFIIRLWREIYSYWFELIYIFKVISGCRMGITLVKREPPVIVSLATIPERIKKVHLCVETLLRQSVKPDKIILYIDESDREKITPSLKKQQERGLCIKFCKNIGPYGKFFYALKEFPKSIIVTADDDVFYPACWLKKLYYAYIKDPRYIYCWRAHLITRSNDGKLESYNNWIIGAPGVQGPSFFLCATGVSGVLYPPQSLPQEVLNEEVFMNICSTNDDIWLKAMSILNGIQVKKVEMNSKHFPLIRKSQIKNLWYYNTQQGGNDRTIQLVFSRYNLLNNLSTKKGKGNKY